MRDPVIITWNFANWLTVFLMAVVGFAVVSFGYQFYQNKVSGSSSASS